jgi:N-acetylglucosamine transport system permease protein
VTTIPLKTTGPASTSAPPRRRRGRRASRLGLGQRLGAVLVWLVVAFNVALLVWLVASSLKTTRAIFDNPWSLPTDLELGNYARAWSDSKFGAAAINTVAVVVVAGLLIVGFAAPAAYALARGAARVGQAVTALLAVGMGIPFQVIMIPLFVMIQRLNLVNSLTGLVLIYVATSLPFTVILLTGFFRTLPSEMEEAAALDGAGVIRTFVTIMLPLVRSGLITAFLLNVIGLWNETFIALIFLQSAEKQTLSLALLGFMQRQQYNGADWGGLFAGVCILILPTLLLYVWLGRRIVEGLTLGAGK